ncbi:hypothetical protein [Granulicella sibirica]|uniref:Uncharacterized protein n=1 Tax=Granulicella sibirica TaxID=2479048 RepID=A0A4Q0SY30_9BACT|nr:hypothetical protein [Granulicella sibirica]RXH54071.1 hypothetical protein GRAN_5040 [Granulicella sibirica]
MMEVVLTGNPEAGRLEAEVCNERYDLVAIVYEDNTGVQVEKHGAEELPDDLLSGIKDELSTRPNRKGIDDPGGMTLGQYSLWLLEKDEPAR